MSDVLDGNAIAGDLFAAFGRDMTAAVGTCRHCGRQGAIAELRVYLSGIGSVARCPACGTVVMVLVTIGEECRAHLPALALAETGEQPPSD